MGAVAFFGEPSTRMPETATLLHLLADGRFHSGQRLAAELGVTRGAVWKRLQALSRALGVEVQAVRGRGYRLAQALELLDGERILARMSPGPRAAVSRLEVFTRLDSTNRYLRRKALEGAPRGSACLAEYQEAGRGRRGRDWVSPFGGNIYLSLLWRFSARGDLSGLSLALGVAALRAIRRTGLAAAGLKWPNDIVCGGRKLAGILLEMAGEASGPSYVVAGIGVNVRMGAAGSAIDQPWVDLESLLGHPVARNAFAAALLEEAVLAMIEYERDGLAGFAEAWAAADVLSGQTVAVRLEDRTLFGVARGIDATGALLVEREGGLHSFTAGEVSVRAGS